MPGDIRRYRGYRVIDARCWRTDWGQYTEFCIVVEDTDKLYVDIHEDKAILVIGIDSGATAWDIIHELLHIVGLDESKVINAVQYIMELVEAGASV